MGSVASDNASADQIRWLSYDRAAAKNDVWSAGVLAFTMTFVRLPLEMIRNRKEYDAFEI